MAAAFPLTSNRRIRIFHFNPWADRLEQADDFLSRIAELDLAARVTDPNDAALLRKAQLDRDWHGENTRAFSLMRHSDLEFLPVRVLGPSGFVELAKSPRPSDEEWWLLFDGQNPQKLADALDKRVPGALGKLMPHLTRNGVRVIFYAFDEASRTMPCFAQVAPHLQVLIHDENPLDPKARALLPRNCIAICRSWVANLIPFFVPFHEQPDEKILFLGSQLGLTEHRKRQIDYLQKKFGDRFLAIHDHSIDVGARATLNRFKVSFCPEGRKFDTPAMASSHTDRPFWSGCMGMVPVPENSRAGGRLEALAETGMILRYSHANLEELGAACEQALAVSTLSRRKIYDHFNRRETIGTVVSEALSAAGGR